MKSHSVDGPASCLSIRVQVESQLTRMLTTPPGAAIRKPKIGQGTSISYCVIERAPHPTPPHPGVFGSLMGVLGYLMGVLGYLMGVLGYLMGVLGYYI